MTVRPRVEGHGVTVDLVGEVTGVSPFGVTNGLRRGARFEGDREGPPVLVIDFVWADQQKVP